MQKHKMKVHLPSYSQDVFKAERGSRPNVKKVLIVITDGESQDGTFLGNAVYSAEQKKIVRFAIGVSCMHIIFHLSYLYKMHTIQLLRITCPKILIQYNQIVARTIL